MNKTLLQRIATAISTAPLGETYEDRRNNEAKAVLLEVANWIEKVNDGDVDFIIWNLKKEAQ